MPTARYAWYALGVLSVINLLNYVDRQIMFALYPYVQDELGFSDFQLGLLGAAFLIVHSICSVPGGVLADRWFKRKVIALGVALWSLATVLGAVARAFVDMFVYRALVGVGEAAYHPAANAMISDYFPPTERGRAMGVFSVGMVLGGGGGMIVGTVVADFLGWRYAFLAAGVPGFLLAALAWRLREVPRPARTVRTDPGGWKRLLRIPTVRYNFLGGVCVTFCIGGLIAWTVSFIDRYHVRDPARPPAVTTLESAVAALVPGATPAMAPLADAVLTAALGASAVHTAALPRAERSQGELARLSSWFGLGALLAGIFGALAGGWLADRLMRWRKSGRFIVSAAGYLLGLPFVLGALWASDPWTFLGFVYPGMFFFTWYMGPSIAILHDVVAFRYRATIAAWYIFTVHLLGDALSPPIIGWVSEQSELRYALLVPLAMAVLGSAFFLVGGRFVAGDVAALEREVAQQPGE